MVEWIKFCEFMIVRDFKSLVLAARIPGVVELVMGSVKDLECRIHRTWWLDDTSCLVGDNGVAARFRVGIGLVMFLDGFDLVVAVLLEGNVSDQ